MAGPGSAAARPLLLLGPPASGRSALLFRAALAAAAASPAGRALFLAPRPFQRLPGGGAAAAAGFGALQRIQFLYPTSLQDLLRLLASLHDTLPGSPSLIALDSLEEYLGACPGPHVAAQLAALLLDTVNHFSQKCSSDSVGCRLMVAVRSPEEGGDAAELSAVQRYFEARCWLRVETPEGGSSEGRPATKLVRAHLSQPGDADREWMLIFDPREEMKISPLPCQSDGVKPSESSGPPTTGAHCVMPDSWFWTSGDP